MRNDIPKGCQMVVPSKTCVFSRYRAHKRAKDMAQEATVLLGMNGDILSEDLKARLSAAIKQLRIAARLRTDYAVALTTMENASAVLEEASRLLPKKPSPMLFEIVETLVVAFGVAMAFRAYFFQPFKIPTGSMQPTLYGIHSEKCDDPDVLDCLPVLSAVKWLFTGKTFREVVADEDGTLTISTDHMRHPGFVIFTLAGKRFYVPTDVLERGEVNFRTIADPMPDNPATSEVELARGIVRKGQKLWSGYVISGDQVFVNRFLWNLRPPKRDEIVVFATSSSQIMLGENFAAQDGDQRVPILASSFTLRRTPISGLVAAQHYIKRLVGMPGERVSVSEPYVCTNGVPVMGFRGMDRESSRMQSKTGPLYAGYAPTDAPGLPPLPNAYLRTASDFIDIGDAYLPMGDNTHNSYDGRYWGTVPRRQMLGPAACVYWPISCRWGSLW